MPLDRNTALAMMGVSVVMNFVEIFSYIYFLSHDLWFVVANGVFGTLVTCLLIYGVFYHGIQMWMGLVPVTLSIFDIFTAIKLQDDYISYDWLRYPSWLQFVVVLCIGKVI